MAFVNAAITYASASNPTGLEVFEYLYELKSSAGAVLEGQKSTSPSASVMFGAQAGPQKGLTVSAHAQSSDGAMIGHLIVSAPFDIVAASTVLLPSAILVSLANSSS